MLTKIDTNTTSSPVAALGWTFAIDGSNFAYHDDKPYLERLLRVLARLREQFPGGKLVIYCDASLGPRLPQAQRRRYRELIASPSSPFYECRKGTIADEILLQFASNQGECVVVSNDHFRTPTEVELRLGVPLLKVHVDSQGVRPQRYVDIYADPDRPTLRIRWPLRRLLVST